MEKTVDVIMLTWNKLEFTRKCIESFLKYVRYPYRLICVDNGSTDGTVEYLESAADVLIKNDVNIGAVKARNQGLLESDADYVLFIDNDIEVAEDIIAQLVKTAESDDSIGIVGPFLNQNLPFNQQGYDVPPSLSLHFVQGQALEEICQQVYNQRTGIPRDISYVISCCMLTKRQVINDVGFFDEEYIYYSYEDFDYCLRAKEFGHRVVLSDDCFVWHHINTSVKQFSYLNLIVNENEQTFVNKWRKQNLKVAIIYDNTVGPNTIGEYCKRALEQLCTKVEHFLPAQLNSIDEDFDLYLNIDDGLQYTLPSHLRPAAWWVIDPRLQYEWYLKKAKLFDFVFAAQKDDAERFKSDGVCNVIWLPLACDPFVHRQFNDAQKQYDVVFVGNEIIDSELAKRLELIRKRFEKIFIGDTSSPTFSKEDMAKIYSQSKIIFNGSAKNDINTRVFEAMACGGLLVTDDLASNGQNELFQSSVHFVTYKSESELIDIIEKYLQDDVGREKIARQGMLEARTKHTYRKRMEKLLDSIRDSKRSLRKEVNMFKEEMVPTKRAVVDINRPCNAKCQMCYYTYSDENWTKSYQQVKQELIAARQRGNTSVDFTGGEPTICAQITDMVKFAETLGLHTCIITNGLAVKRIEKIVESGCWEWLLSIHGYGKGQNDILGVPNAWDRMQETVNLLKSRNCFIRVNCTLTKHNYKDLPKLAEYYTDTVDAHIVNFINFNPYYEWGVTEQPEINKRLNEVQVRVSDIAPYLKEAIDYLQERNIWVNVRYFPFCALKGYEKYICNYPQVMFDKCEWDYGVMPKTTQRYLEHGRLFQRNMCIQDGICGKCGILDVCGGANKNYVAFYGDDELQPYTEISDNPYYFRDDHEADIIIPVYEHNENTYRLLNEIVEKTQPPYNLIMVQRHQSASKNRNYGLNRSNSRYVIMCDDDIVELPYGWNRKMTDILKENGHILAVSARLMNRDGTPGVNSAQNYDLTQPIVEVNMIPTACCAFRKTSLRFDERFIRAGWEDTDFFMQLLQKENGFLVIANDVKVVHLNEEKHDGGAKNVYNRELFLKKWHQKNVQKATEPLSGFSKEEPKVSVLLMPEQSEFGIPNRWNFVRDLIQHTPESVEITLLAMDGSADYPDYSDFDRPIKVVEGGKINEWAESVQSKYIVLLSPSFDVEEDWLRNLVEHAESDNQIAMVGLS